MPPKAKKNAGEQNLMERKKDAIVAWFGRRKPDTMNVIEVAIQNDWTADKSLKPGGKFKDLLKELIHEGRVQQKKCGTATVFYTFPSNQIANVITKSNELAGKLDETKIILEKKKIEYRQLLIGREDTYDRQVLLLQQDHFQSKLDQIQNEINQYSDNDPLFVNELENQIRKMIECINISTERIFLLLRFYTNINAFDNSSPEEILNNVGLDLNQLDYVLPPWEISLYNPKHNHTNNNTNTNDNNRINDTKYINNFDNTNNSHFASFDRIKQWPKPLLLPTTVTYFRPEQFIPFNPNQKVDNMNNKVVNMIQQKSNDDKTTLTNTITMHDLDNTNPVDYNDNKNNTQFTQDIAILDNRTTPKTSTPTHDPSTPPTKRPPTRIIKRVFVAKPKLPDQTSTCVDGAATHGDSHERTSAHTTIQSTSGITPAPGVTRIVKRVVVKKKVVPVNSVDMDDENKNTINQSNAINNGMVDDNI